jgi:branched-chain amino acid aminotransferase
MSVAVPLAYVNGRLLPQAEAGLPLHDAGFVWGATVTDLCRTIRHRLYRWPDHLIRFRNSCRGARIRLRHSDNEISRLAEDLAAHNAGLLRPEQDLALVLLATPGPIGYYVGQTGEVGEGEPTLILHTFPLPLARYRRLIEEGARLVVPSIRQVPAECVDPHIKQRSRMHWWLAEQEVHQADPAAQALLLDTAGHVTETAAANFLIVRNGVVLSPPRSRRLAGVSLGVVEELCRQLGISFAECDLSLQECLTADEALLTCTSYCLAGVRRINDVDLLWPGPLLLRLVDAWSAEVGMDLHRQILVEM